MNEIWEDIPTYEGLYKISSYGRVKSLIGWDGHKHIKREKILTPAPDKDGYLRVCLSKLGKHKMKSVSILVATAFVINSFNKPQVNHNDGNKSNNFPYNLKWCTAKENIHHAWETGLSNVNHIKKKVLMFRVDGEPLLWFESATEASIKCNIDRTTITACCRNRKKTSGGYKWEYYPN